MEIGCEVKYDNMRRGWCSKAISGSSSLGVKKY